MDAAKAVAGTRFGARHPAEDDCYALLEETLSAPASDMFHARVKLAVQEMPPFIRRSLIEGGWRIRTARWLTQALPFLGRVRPRGHDEPDASWMNIDGVCCPDIRQIAIAENVLSRQHPLVSMVSGILDSAWRHEPVVPLRKEAGRTVCYVTKPERVLRHEVGHALYVLWGEAPFNALFQQAYVRDFENLSTPQKQKFKYYIQPNAQGEPTEGGQDEAFAESYASLQGGGCENAWTFQQVFPASVQIVNEKFRQFYKKWLGK